MKSNNRQELFKEIFDFEEREEDPGVEAVVQQMEAETKRFGKELGRLLDEFDSTVVPYEEYIRSEETKKIFRIFMILRQMDLIAQYNDLKSLEIAMYQSEDFLEALEMYNEYTNEQIPHEAE